MAESGDSVTLIARLAEALDQADVFIKSCDGDDDLRFELSEKLGRARRVDLRVLELRESDRQSSESRDDVDEFFSATDWLDSGSASALEVEADRYDEGWDAGRDALLNSAACSVCGDDHDRMDDAACPGCEAITLGEWIDKVGVERSDAAWEAEDARLASATKPEASPRPENLEYRSGTDAVPTETGGELDASTVECGATTVAHPRPLERAEDGAAIRPRAEADGSWVCSWCGDEFEPGDWSSTDCCSCDPVPASSLPSILKEARKEAKDAMDAAFADEELALAAGKSLERAAFIAQHLFEMIDTERWRASGGDDGQGHYEGEYRAAQISEEIRSWTKPFSLASTTTAEPSPSPESKTICTWPFCECDPNIPLMCGLPAPSSRPVSTDEEEGQGV